MKRNYFSDYHPVVILVFFLFTIISSILLTHPFFMLASSICAFLCCVIAAGIKQTLQYILFCLPLIIIMAFINPFFNHRGDTPLLYVNSQPITLEAIIYGFLSGVMVLAMVLWFTCLHKTLGNYKLNAIFGKIIPSITLIITMVFRFIPYFGRQLEQITTAQKTLGTTSGGMIKKFKSGASIMSALLSVSLESTMGTSDSMYSRGYGLKGKTCCHSQKMTARDHAAIVIIFAGVGLSLFAFSMLQFTYFPALQAELSATEVILLICYICFLCIPVFIQAWEEFRWIIVQKRI